MIPVVSGAGCDPTSPGTVCTCFPGRQKLGSAPFSFMTSARTPSDVVTIVFDDRAGVHRRDAFEKALGAVSDLPPPQKGGPRTTTSPRSRVAGSEGSTTPDGLVALLTFLAETQPTRSSNHVGDVRIPAPDTAHW